MLFHRGTPWRLNEFGCLSRLSRVSSVSGTDAGLTPAGPAR